MRTITLIIIFQIYITAVLGQSMQIQTLQDFYKEFKSSQFQQGITFQEKTIDGSPHENNEFAYGVVVTRSNLRYENIPLRFNIYTNEMEFKTEDGTVLYIASPEIIEFIGIGDEIYLYAPYSLANRLLRGFFKVLVDGDVTLLLKQNITLRDAEPAQPYKDAIPARFIRTPDEFYIRKAPAEAHKVANRKELLHVLGDQSSRMEEFLKKNKTRFNRAEDLIHAIEYYNSLLKE